MGVDRNAIDEQLRALGETGAWWDEREFRELPRILREGERITGLAMGALVASSGRRKRSQGGRRGWLFVATDRRLLCLQGDGFARRQLDLDREEITRVTHRFGLKEVRTSVATGGLDCQLRIPRMYGVRFAEAVNALLPYDPRKQLPPEVEAFAWIPGMTRVAEIPVVARIISKVAMLSPPDPAAPLPAVEGSRDSASLERISELEGRVENLQFQVERLQQSVEFLEGLLQKEFRGQPSSASPAESLSPGSPSR